MENKFKPGDQFICIEEYKFAMGEPIFIKDETYTIGRIEINPSGYQLIYFTNVNIQMWDPEIRRYFKPKFFYGK